MSIPSRETSPVNPGVSRVLGWDVLRGLSALAVAAYHLLIWQDVVSLHSFGSYGVYLFFVLSGASLAYTYAGRFERRQFSWPEFLWVRYMRLAPLYLMLMLLVLPWKLFKEGVTGPLLAKLALNTTFLFGLYDPAVSSMLVGGWSLGIEAIFYLLFPLILAAASSRAAIVGFALLTVLQAAWIWRVFDLPGGYAAHAVFYHQAPAFIAYFVGGCLIGLARRANPGRSVPAAGVLVGIAGGFLLLLLFNPAQAGDELIGWRGATLFTLCFVMVWGAGLLQVRKHAARRIAAHLGDATYGLYLIHPVLFFGLSFVVLPRLGLEPPQQWTLGARLLLASAIGIASFLLAILSERYFERPLREWSKSRSNAYGKVVNIS